MTMKSNTTSITSAKNI